jgi:hypothetical protein
MLTALLGNGNDLLPLKRLIIDRTEGTPFFMEEIVQALFEDGVLQRNGTVKLAKSMNAVKVPATVQAVLASRIDRLPAEDKELLQTLAVLGREFRLGLVRRVTLRADDELEHRLAGLQAGEFIYEQPATGDVEYTFKHALTFGTTPKEQLDSYKAAVWCYLLEHSDLQEKRRALLKFHTDDRATSERHIKPDGNLPTTGAIRLRKTRRISKNDSSANGRNGRRKYDICGIVFADSGCRSETWVITMKSFCSNEMIDPRAFFETAKSGRAQSIVSLFA